MIDDGSGGALRLATYFATGPRLELGLSPTCFPERPALAGRFRMRVCASGEANFQETGYVRETPNIPNIGGFLRVSCLIFL